MSTTNVFVEHRVRALASVFLTRRPDVEVIDLGDGVPQILVRVLPDQLGEDEDRDLYLAFGCILRGTSTALASEAEADKFLNLWRRHRRSETNPRFCFPVLVLVFSMVEDQGYAAWYADPVVDPEGCPALLHARTFSCSRLQRDSLEQIVAKVTAWYQAASAQLIRESDEVR
jgi:hypothetical protein